MDEALIRTLKDQADQALSDLPMEGMVGLAAMLSASEAVQKVRSITPENAGEVLTVLKARLSELEAIQRAFDEGKHQGGLDLAFGRMVTVARAAAAKLEGA